MPQSIFELQADLCQTMSSAARLQIVHCLREGPKRVSEIIEITGFTQTKVSQHLGVLCRHGLVDAERQTGTLLYRITNSKIAQVCDSMREVLAEQVTEDSKIVQAIQNTA